MLTPEETGSTVLRALEGRGVGKKPCVVCGTTAWSVSDGFLLASLADKPLDVVLGGEKAMPLIPITCGTCGNTHFINLLKVGISEETLKTFSFKRDDPAPAK